MHGRARALQGPETAHPDTAQDIARLMGALSTAPGADPGAPAGQPCAVGELSAELEMEQPASPPAPRPAGPRLVVGDRSGRSVVYGLFDSHVASLIDEALRHIDHVTAGATAHRDGPLPLLPTDHHHETEEATP